MQFPSIYIRVYEAFGDPFSVKYGIYPVFMIFAKTARFNGNFMKFSSFYGKRFPKSSLDPYVYRGEWHGDERYAKRIIKLLKSLSFTIFTKFL